MYAFIPWVRGGGMPNGITISSKHGKHSLVPRYVLDYFTWYTVSLRYGVYLSYAYCAVEGGLKPLTISRELPNYGV